MHGVNEGPYRRPAVAHDLRRYLMRVTINARLAPSIDAAHGVAAAAIQARAVARQEPGRPGCGKPVAVRDVELAPVPGCLACRAPPHKPVSHQVLPVKNEAAAAAREGHHLGSDHRFLHDAATGSEARGGTGSNGNPSPAVRGGHSREILNTANDGVSGAHVPRRGQECRNGCGPARGTLPRPRQLPCMASCRRRSIGHADAAVRPGQGHAAAGDAIQGLRRERRRPQHGRWVFA